jgi:hypothetical protein
VFVATVMLNCFSLLAYPLPSNKNPDFISDTGNRTVTSGKSDDDGKDRYFTRKVLVFMITVGSLICLKTLTLARLFKTSPDY